MSEIGAWEFERRSDRLYIHFDVKDHFIKLDTFIQTANSARRVIEALDQTFFQGQLEYEIIVLAPEEGTFLSKLAIYLGGGVTAVFAFLNSDVGSAYVEGLTGQPPAYWARGLGEGTRMVVDDLTEFLAAEGSTDIPPPPTIAGDDASQRTAAKVVVEMARGVLEKSSDQLAKLGMEIGDLPDALEARADFYGACIEDSEVRRVGFTPEHSFPIPRSSFPERAQRPERKPKDDEEPEWHVSIENIYVTSPNWDQEDQKARQWKGKDSARRDAYFVIDDAEFWALVRRKNLHVDVLDNLRVQWACQIVAGRPKNRRVLRVLEFNGVKLADPLPPAAIRAILGDYAPLGGSQGQQTLFDN